MTSMADLTVYRSTHPGILAAWDKAHEQAEQIGRQRRQLLDELGFEGRPALIDGRRMVGVQHTAEHGPIPEGWRRDQHTDGAIVPDRRRATGKAIARRLDALTMPDFRRMLPGGMPQMAWDLESGKIHWPSFALMEGAVYVRWGCDPEKAEKGDRIDPEIWERVKLSEYYTVVERTEQAQAGGA
ncbi:hypothetical protein [Microbispora sp. CA-102843]|uniref:hypothetical protein n=1 Tax=Microbispora sp. CA-102843 TaxID=3239952 RepID=UPI003D89FAC3